MWVTQIQELPGKRCKIYLDQGPAFVLYRGELSRYGIAPDRELDEADYREIMEELLPKRARLRAMNLLKSRWYTKKQLTDKLREGGYPSGVVEEAVAYVESYGYIDDLRYAVDYMTSHEKQSSLRRMEQDLLRRGVSGEVIGQARSCREQQDEEAVIRALLEKRQYRPDADLKEKQRTYQFLMRRGFPPEIIRQVMHICAFFLIFDTFRTFL